MLSTPLIPSRVSRIVFCNPKLGLGLGFVLWFYDVRQLNSDPPDPFMT